MTVFQIDLLDNVATALEPLHSGMVKVRGDAAAPFIKIEMEIQTGHKVALNTIKTGEPILKYGVVIGRAIEEIPEGSWVHLHNIQSVYDERSGHLDSVTGAPKDTRYE